MEEADHEKCERYQRVPVVHYPEQNGPEKIQKAPAWCSVGRKPGPEGGAMVVEEKIEMFVSWWKWDLRRSRSSFPAASQIEFDFLRQLVDQI